MICKDLCKGLAESDDEIRFIVFLCVFNEAKDLFSMGNLRDAVELFEQAKKLADLTVYPTAPYVAECDMYILCISGISPSLTSDTEVTSAPLLSAFSNPFCRYYSMLFWADNGDMALFDNMRTICREDDGGIFADHINAKAKMNNGEFLAVYDIVVNAPGRPSGQIQVDGVTYTHSPDLYKKSTSIDKWDIADPGTVPMLPDGRYMGLSPWCAYSPTIGDTGMLVIYGRTWANTDKSQTNLFLSFDYGETYVELENPFEYMISGESPNKGKLNCGYSPSIIFSADGKSMYFAVNKVNKYGTGYSIDMVKIDIIY